MAKKKPVPGRRIVEGWSGVASISCGKDGYIVAGENGGYQVACWDGAGTIVWQKELGAHPMKARYAHRVILRVLGDDVIVLTNTGHSFAVFDLLTGKERAQHEAPTDPRKLEPTPDGRRLVLRASTATHVFDYPSFERVARIDAYANTSALALTPDGRYAAVCGSDVHVIDLKRLQVARSFKVGDSPWSLGWTPSGEVLIAARNVIELYDAVHDFAPLKSFGTKRSPTTTAIATSPKSGHIALANDRGTVALYDPGTFTIVAELKGHDPTVPDTGSRHIAEIAFAPTGELVVSAPPKNQAMGLTVHVIESASVLVK